MICTVISVTHGPLGWWWSVSGPYAVEHAGPRYYDSPTAAWADATVAEERVRQACEEVPL
jgi:hypothetical protein